MNRKELFERVLHDVSRLRDQFPISQPLRSIADQLSYLIDFESGRASDLARLRAMNIGVLTASAVEDLNTDVANELHAVCDVIREMMGEVKIQEIEKILVCMSDLARIGSLEDWAVALLRQRGRLADDPGTAVAEIRRWYGGMGSLNDLVLYQDGNVLAAESTEFDALRTRLYDLCRLSAAHGH
jgi:hypothetical protein